MCESGLAELCASEGKNSVCRRFADKRVNREVCLDDHKLLDHSLGLGEFKASVRLEVGRAPCHTHFVAVTRYVDQIKKA